MTGMTNDLKDWLTDRHNDFRTAGWIADWHPLTCWLTVDWLTVRLTVLWTSLMTNDWLTDWLTDSALSKCFVMVGRITEVVGGKGLFAFIISQHKWTPVLSRQQIIDCRRQNCRLPAPFDRAADWLTVWLTDCDCQQTDLDCRLTCCWLNC